MSTPAQTPQSLSQFGRKWEIKIITGQDSSGNSSTITASSSDFGVGALRATFDIWQPGYAAFWYGDIVIYNFDASTSQTVLTEGMQVIVSAGYKNGQYGQIFNGKLFQPFVEREDVTDFKTVLHCVMGRPELVNNLISFSQAGPVSQADVAIAMATRASTALSLKYLQGALSTKMLPRGKVVFGDPSRYFDQVSKDNSLVWWYDGQNVNMGDFNTPEPEAIIISPPPKGSLIGTPQQTEQGVAMRVLLDPRLRIKLNPVQVKLDMSSIRFLKQQIGQQPSILDQDGVYVVGAVRHTGDTRGNDWYTDIVGYTTVGGKLGMLGATASIVGAANDQYIDTK